MAENKKDVQEFTQQAQQAQTSFLGEYVQWLRHNKKWWLTPILLGLFFMGFFIFLAATPVAPFIYTLF